MNETAETIGMIVAFILAVCFFLWFKYIQADGNIACIFDYSPRTCAIVERNLK